MQVLSLQLENVKSYAQATIDFTLGTNAIVGQNGAGKSTILEAIGFALFDALAYRQSDFVREGEKTATITVKFLSSHDEHVYEVIRKCGSSSVYYVFDPELDLRVCEGKVDAQRFLRLHLGADQGANLERLFSDAVGVSQGTFTAAFQLRPAERKSIFDPLLQVDEYDTAWTRLREPRSLLDKQRQDLDVEIGKLEGRLEQLPTLQAAVDARIQEVKNAQADLAATSEQRETVLAQRNALDHAHQQLTELQQQQRQAEVQLSGLRDQQRAADRAHAEAAHAVEIVA
ncbi:MAG: SMC family ATPase, partial [Caldilineaceae bacterium]|nr:SMC family ATPase [Caldilineaceae bacterium]